MRRTKSLLLIWFIIALLVSMVIVSTPPCAGNTTMLSAPTIIDDTLTPQPVTTIRPMADGTNTGWDGDYTDWDETVQNGDTDYVSATGMMLLESSELEDPVHQPWDIARVRVVAYARTVDVITDEELVFMLVIGGTSYWADYPTWPKPGYTLTTTYEKYSWDWGKNPATGDYWTWSDIDALEAGVESQAPDWVWTGEMRVTQLYVEVEGPRLTVDIEVSDVKDLWGYSLILDYDTTLLTATSYTSLDPFTYALPSEINDTAGYVSVSYSKPMGELGETGSMPLVQIAFLVEGLGATDLDLHDTKLTAPGAVFISHVVTDGYFSNIGGVTPDFELTAFPASLSIQQGSSDTLTITATSLNGFNSAVSLSVSGAPSGVTTTLSPVSVTPPADGTATSTLTVSVGASTAIGTYTLTVTGTSGALTHTVDISLTVTAAPDFSISASPTSLTIAQGDSDTSTITITSVNVFNSPVTLSVSGAPTGVTTSFSPNPVTPPADSSTTSTLTISVGTSTALGTYTLTVTGTSGTLTHDIPISLTVTVAPDFSISVDPTSLTIQQGTSNTATVTVTSLNGFSASVSLSISGLPTGVTTTFDPTSVTPPADGTATSTLTINVGATVTPDTYSLTITGTSGILSHTVTLSLTVTELPPEPDFNVSASPNSLTIVQGESDTSTITITSLHGFSSAVTLSVSDAPTGVTTSFDVNPVTPPSGGTATSTLTISVDVSTVAGVYTLTVTGTSGTLTHTMDISLTVSLPPDFSISASPTSLTIVQGGSDTSTITVTSLNGFNSAVTLSVSGAPTGVTTTFSANPITPPPDGTATSTLTISVDSTVTVGTYTLTVEGTSGTLTHTVDIILEVAVMPDFSVSVDPTSLEIQQGSSDTATVTVTSLNGFSASVSLSISGLPTDVTATFDPTSVTPPADDTATSTLTITVGAAVVLGTYSLTITGTSGSLTHTASLSLTITGLPPEPDFSISASPTTLSIVLGDSGVSTMTVTSINAFNSAVELTIAGLPSSVTATFDPMSVTPPADGTATSVLTISVDSSAVVGTYTLTITGTSGTLEHQVDIQLTIIQISLPLFFVHPAETTASPGESFTIEIRVANVTNLWGYLLFLSYDTNVLTATGYSSSPIFGLEEPCEINDPEGYVSISFHMPFGVPVGFSTVTPVPIAYIDFTVDALGWSWLDLHDSVFSDPFGKPIEHEEVDGYFANVIQYVLTIEVVGSGTTNPSPGTYTYNEGTLVTVDAIPDSDWRLDHWELEGVDAGSADPITVTMDSDHTLTAVFVEMPPVGDVTPPEITINKPVTKDYLHSETITLDFSAVDAESGVASISATLDGLTVENGELIELFTLTLGKHTLAVTAVDNAGNSATKIVEFNVIATVGSLQDLVNMFFESGYFNSPKGIRTSLIKKLYAAEKHINAGQIEDAKSVLGAFINQLEAQSGKHVSEYAANILIADAQHVIDNL